MPQPKTLPEPTVGVFLATYAFFPYSIASYQLGLDLRLDVYEELCRMGIQSPGGIRHILCTESCAFVMGKTWQDMARLTRCLWLNRDNRAGMLVRKCETSGTPFECF